MPKEENEKPAEKSNPTIPEKSNNNTVSDRTNAKKSTKPWVIGGVVVIIILFLALVGSMYKLNSQSQGLFDRDGVYVYGHRGMPHMSSNFFFSSTDSNGTTTNSTTAISGVVTAVKGNSFDIGGGGTKTTIKTNDDTTWNTTGKKVSVNDSVLVYGTVSDNTITATSIQILNQ